MHKNLTGTSVNLSSYFRSLCCFFSFSFFSLHKENFDFCSLSLFRVSIPFFPPPTTRNHLHKISIFTLRLFQDINLSSNEKHKKGAFNSHRKAPFYDFSVLRFNHFPRHVLTRKFRHAKWIEPKWRSNFRGCLFSCSHAYQNIERRRPLLRPENVLLTFPVAFSWKERLKGSNFRGREKKRHREKFLPSIKQITTFFFSTPARISLESPFKAESRPRSLWVRDSESALTSSGPLSGVDS